VRAPGRRSPIRGPRQLVRRRPGRWRTSRGEPHTVHPLGDELRPPCRPGRRRAQSIGSIRSIKSYGGAGPSGMLGFAGTGLRRPGVNGEAGCRFPPRCCRAGGAGGRPQGRATFEQDRSHTPLAERLEQQVQIQAGIHPRQANDVGAAFHVQGVSLISNGDHGGRRVIQDTGRGGYARCFPRQSAAADGSLPRHVLPAGGRDRSWPSSVPSVAVGSAQAAPSSTARSCRSFRAAQVGRRIAGAGLGRPSEGGRAVGGGLAGPTVTTVVSAVVVVVISGPAWRHHPSRPSWMSSCRRCRRARGQS
jgi:hypothetical protein